MEQIVLTVLATIGVTLEGAKTTYQCQPEPVAGIICVYNGLKRSYPCLVEKAEFARESAKRAKDFAM